MSKIVLVIPTLKTGGMERVMSELANYFDTKGHEVHIFFLVRHDPFYHINEGIEVNFPSFEYTTAAISKPYYWLKIMKFLRSDIIKLKPDTVFSIPQDYSNITLLALYGTRIPVFISDRNSPNMPVPWLKMSARKILYPLASGIVAQTFYARAGLLKKGIKNNNIKVIPNPLKTIISEPKLENTSKIILNIGRMVREKNQKELIDIFARTRKKDWILKIVGGGHLKSELQQHVNDTGLKDRVLLSDAVSDVDSLMSEAEIFAFTSIFEGFPNSLSEAMAYPLATISYDCIAGPSDLINDGVNGYLVQRDNQGQYVEKLQKLMDDADLRKTLKSESVKNRELYSAQNIGEQFLNFILNSPDGTA